MELEIQQKLREDKKMYAYLKENSEWMKLLNRNKDHYQNFINEMKEKYKLRVTDKVSDAIDNIDLISTVLSSLK